MAAVGTASAHDFETRAGDRVDTAPNLFQFSYDANAAKAKGKLAPAQQHGGDTNHLPPTAKNMQLVSRHEPGGEGNIAAEQIADLAVFKGSPT